MNNNLYIVDGGIGKNICFTSCLNDLGKINVMATWPKIFKNHPNVNFCYPYDISPWTDTTRFLNKFNDVYTLNVYDSFFYKNKIHLITNFKKQLNINSEETVNEIYFTEKENQEIQPLLQQLQDFVMVQFMGSDEAATETDFIGARGITKEQGQKIINILNFDLKLNVLNVFSLIDHFENTAKIDLTLDYMNYANLLKYAKGFIGIDSCLNHMSANRFCDTKGVVLWNDENVVERFCYDKNINIITNTPRTMRFNVNEIIDNFQKIRRKDD